MGKRNRSEQYRLHVKKVGPVRCHWCGVCCEHPVKYKTLCLAATKDHLEPRSKTRPQNNKGLVWACRACNQVKGPLTENQWREFMKYFTSYKEFYRQSWLERLRNEFLLVIDGGEKHA